MRDVGSADFLDVALRDAIAKGLVRGPRMLVATKGIGATGGHFDDTNGFRDRRPEAERTSSRARDACRQLAPNLPQAGTDAVNEGHSARPTILPGHDVFAEERGEKVAALIESGNDTLAMRKSQVGRPDAERKISLALARFRLWILS